MGLKRACQKKQKREHHSSVFHLDVRFQTHHTRAQDDINLHGNAGAGTIDNDQLHVQVGGESPPSYEQSVMHRHALPPAYCNAAMELDDAPACDTPSYLNLRVTMVTDIHTAPPTYDASQTNGSEAMEVGGAVFTETNPASAENNDPT